MNVRALWAKLRGIRHLEWILLMVLVGVAGSIFMQASGAPRAGAGQTALENRLSQVLSAVEGAGRVEVIIHMAIPESAAVQVGAFGEPAQGKAEERPGGVIVVAEGADQLSVRLALARAVQTLLDLPASAVEVLPKERTQ